MNKEFKHIVVIRLAQKWVYYKTGLNWENWVKESIELYEKYCRPSFKQQTNQNFVLCPVVNEEVTDIGELLPNEIVIKTCKGRGLVQALNEQFSDKKKYMLVTRCDRDDAIKYDYIDILHNSICSDVNSGIDKSYYDTPNIYRCDVKTGNIFKKNNYVKTVTPFVSVLETLDSKGNIRCNPYLFPHDHISKHILGKKINSLEAIQFIHEHNVLNRADGDIVNIEDKDLFLKQFIG